MANNAQLLLIAKARRRRAEAESGAPAADPSAEPTQAATGMTEPVNSQPPSIIDHIMRGANYAGQTIGQVADRALGGAASVAGLPVDAINASPMLANVIPGVHAGPMSEHPIGGSEWLNELRRGFGIVQPSAPPSDPFQKIVGRVAEEVGGAAVPVGGILGATARTTLPEIREGGGLARYFMEPAAVDPAKYIGRELGAATAAGTGAGIANTFTDRNTVPGQVADLVGAIMGVGTTAIGRKVAGGVGSVFNALRQNPNYIDDTVKSAVVDRVAKAADLPGANTAGKPYDTDPLVQKIMDGGGRERPSQVIPGFQESLADRTADPGIASLEYSRQSGPSAGEFTRRRSENSQAVDTAMSAVAPKATPGEFRSALDEARSTKLSAAEQNTQGAQSEFDRYIQNLQPQMGAEDRGSTVRAGLANAERAARETEHAVWEGTGDAQVDPAPLADTLDETRASLTQARQQRIGDLGPTVDIPRGFAPRAVDPETGLTDAAAPTPAAAPVDLAELNDMRSTLLDEQRKALSGPQADRNRAAAIGKLIDDMNDHLGSDAVPADVRERTQAARAVSRDVNERFNRPNDPISAALSTKEGRPDVPDSAVASSFVRPDAGQASNIDRLLAETDLSSHGRPVRDALKDEILAGVDKAKGNPERLDGYLNQFGRVFDRFPDLRDEIAKAAGAGRALNEAGAAETAVKADLGTPDGTVKGRSAVGKYLQFSDAKSDSAMNEVLSSKDPGKAADDLMTAVGNNPKAVEGARAAFWNKLKAESQSVDNSQRSLSGGRAWRGDWLKSFLDKPATAAVAERLYRDNPEHLAAVRKYAEVLDNVDLRQRGKAPGTSGTAQGVNPILSPETLQSRFYAFMQGRVGGTYLVTSIAAVVARRAVRKAQTEAIERLTDKVLLNPELAAQMLKENNPANRAALARKAKGWLGHEASTVVNLLDEDDKNDPTVKAVMR